MHDSKLPCSLGPGDASYGDEEGIGRESLGNIPLTRCYDELAEATVPFGGDDVDPGSHHDVPNA